MGNILTIEAVPDTPPARLLECGQGAHFRHCWAKALAVLFGFECFFAFRL